MRGEKKKNIAWRHPIHLNELERMQINILRATLMHVLKYAMQKQ
jgi:hypothetical protein